MKTEEKATELKLEVEVLEDKIAPLGEGRGLEVTC